MHEINGDEDGNPQQLSFPLMLILHLNTLLAYKPKMLSAKLFLKLCPELRITFRLRITESCLTGEAISFQNYSSALNKYYHVAAFSPEHGQFATMINDVTERKLAEDALMTSRQQLMDIIDFLPDATFVIDNGKKSDCME
ncbi:MAG: hypothetical protein IPH45_21755 [Bacteroidales bacterium]|nr:hypothetical protein [Bacteroidales bacterium]